MSEYDKQPQERTISIDGMPLDIVRALIRYLEIQEQAVELDNEKKQLRDVIANYMEAERVDYLNTKVEGDSVHIRSSVKPTTVFDELGLQKELGEQYTLILEPDATKVKKCLPELKEALQPYLAVVGSPTDAAVRAAISNGAVKREQVVPYVKMEDKLSFSVSRRRLGTIRESEGEGYDVDAPDAREREWDE